MANRSTANRAIPSGRISVAWSPFALRLAAVLGKLEEDQFLILTVKRSNRFVQFAAQGSYGMRIETTSNSYLTKPEQLNDRQIATLLKAGWNLPTGTPDDSTPEDDPDGSPNFFVEFLAPVSFESVANLAVYTLAEILRVPHPVSLQYAAYDAEGEAIDLPELGLMLEKSKPESDNQENLSQLLLDTLKETTGVSELEYDDGGDIGIRYGSAIVYIRLIEDPLYVRIFSPILHDAENVPDIFSMLNDINANETLVRFFFQNGTIYGVADILALPFVGAYVANAFAHLGSIADEMGKLLQEEFGGRTTFSESIPSSMKH